MQAEKRSERDREAGKPERGSEAAKIEKGKRFPVIIARGIHLFPYRTQKLSLSALMVPGWGRPGRVGRCRIPRERDGETERDRFPRFFQISGETAGGTGRDREVDR